MTTLDPSPSFGPDCRDGKHSACDGRALDVEADEVTVCDCYCHHWTEGEAAS